MPKTLNSKGEKKLSLKEENGTLEDDEYEVEKPVMNDAMMAMLPMSFGKQEKKKDFAAGFEKTKRVV